MKKNHLTLVLVLTAFSAMQSFALVPPPESLRAAKHKEQAKSPDTDTTVIISERTAVFLPHHPQCVSGDSFRTAVFLPHRPYLA
jgi:hypothetical protein